MNDALVQRAFSLLKRQRASLEALPLDDLSSALPIWKNRTIRVLGTVIQMAELRIMNGISTSTWQGDREAFVRFLAELEEGIREDPELYLILQTVEHADIAPAPPALHAGAEPSTTARSVFVVHGHDSLAKVEVSRTLEKLKLESIVLHEQPNEGKTIIEKFERDASRVAFAVVLLSPDDIGYPNGKPDSARPRARQNVILELGYFSAALGRARVCVLYKGEVELPSDYLGVVYVPMDDAGIWRFSLAKELKQAGIAIDLNNLF